MTTAKKRPGRNSAKGSGSQSTRKATPKAAAKSAAESSDRKTRPTPVAPTKKRKFPVLPVVFGVVALALIAAIVFSPDTEIGAEFADVTITGEALPPFSSATGDAGVGLPAPGLDGIDFDGNPVSIQPGEDGPMVVLFLAHWCPHCQAEVPRVQGWLDAGGGVDGVELVSVTTLMNSSRENYPSEEWLDREGWTPPVLRDDAASSAMSSYGSGGTPYWVFVDAEGTVVRRVGGELDTAVLEGYMREIAPPA